MNWRNVLGEEDEVQGASVNCGELKWALNSVSVCVSDNTHGVEIGVDEGVVNIKAQDSEQVPVRDQSFITAQRTARPS